MGCIEKLSRSRIARIERRGKYGDGGGLYLQVSRALVKSWVFRYKINETERCMGLGPLHAVGLKEAREKACRARALLAKGIDPIEARVKTRTCGPENKTSHKTFDECAAEYIDSHQSEWKNPKHKTQWENSLRTYASPHFGKTDVREIDTSLILRALEPIWTAKTETAARLRERIERVLSFAATRGYRDGDNPARWQGHLEELLPKPSKIKTVRHHPAMPYQEMAAFFSLLAVEKGLGAPTLAFTILTAARTSEALAARWAEIDFGARLWIVPGERMKSGRPHRVPLTDAALGILRRQMGLHPDWVFPGKKQGRPVSNSIMLDTLKRMNRRDVTVHGFRTSFRVWAAERTAYPREMAELALAHKLGTQVEEAYQRSDLFERRRDLMLDWAHYVGGDASLGEKSCGSCK